MPALLMTVVLFLVASIFLDGGRRLGARRYSCIPKSPDVPGARYQLMHSILTLIDLALVIVG